MTARPDTGTSRDTRAHVAAGPHHTTSTTTTRGDLMTSTTETRDVDLLQALIAERFGPTAATTRERAATPAELIRLPQRRRAERKAAA